VRVNAEHSNSYLFSNTAFNAIIGSQAVCMIISFGEFANNVSWVCIDWFRRLPRPHYSSHQAIDAAAESSLELWRHLQPDLHCGCLVLRAGCHRCSRKSNLILNEASLVSHRAYHLIFRSLSPTQWKAAL
jgi:hypothetical protein